MGPPTNRGTKPGPRWRKSLPRPAQRLAWEAKWGRTWWAADQTSGKHLANMLSPNLADWASQSPEQPQLQELHTNHIQLQSSSQNWNSNPNYHHGDSKPSPSPHRPYASGPHLIGNASRWTWIGHQATNTMPESLASSSWMPRLPALGQKCYVKDG